MTPGLDWTGTADVVWSVHVVDLAAGDVLLSAGADLALSTASLAKVLVLVELAASFEAGTVDPAELLDRRVTPQVEDSGLWYRMRVDRLPASDVATLVGAVSDNWATNVVIERLGLEAVQRRAALMGLTQTALLDLVRTSRDPDAPARLSVGTARDWAMVFGQLHAGTVASGEVSAQVSEWLAAGVDHSMVLSAFGLDPLVAGNGPGDVQVVNKTGSDDGVRADAGLVVTAQRAVAYACLANWAADDARLLPSVLADMRSLGSALRV